MSPRTLVDALEQAAGRAEAGRGYHFHQEEGKAEPFFSYAGVERASARHGGALQALGLRKGDRLAIILPDNDDFLFTFFGALRAGIIPVPIYPPTGLGQFRGYLESTRHIVARAGARALVTTPTILRLLGGVEAACPSLRKMLSIQDVQAAREELYPVRVVPDDVALLQFTSGSVARPKGVVVTHASLMANVEAINRQGLRVGPDDVAVSWLPLYHDMGLIGFVVAPLVQRVPVILLPPLTFLRRPAVWLRALSRHRGTISYGPNFAYALAAKRVRPEELDGVDLSAWRVAGCGAEPIRADTIETFARTFAPWGFARRAFVPSYGMAESTLAVSFETRQEGARFDDVHGPSLYEEGVAKPISFDHPQAVRLVRCGQVIDGHQIAVFAPDDLLSEHPLPERSIGELRLRGPSLMQGYFDDPTLTAEVMAGGWFHTGDLGYLADGDVIVCGRSKELIIVNGRNFYPHDIEWAAGRVAAVRKGNIVAFSTPERDRERVVVVFETNLLSAEEQQQARVQVRQLIQETLGLTVDEVLSLKPGVLPKTSSGKLQRLLTRRLYEGGALLTRAPTRNPDRLDLARELLRSQLAFLVSRFSRPSEPA
jgi:fatty-acyl-CoA synthase